jgi:uncharacterized protein YecT (DUF1311 family)
MSTVMRTPASLLGLLALTACGSAEEEPISPEALQRLEAQEQRLHAVCSADATYARLKELVFDEAARRRGGAAPAIDEAAAATNLSLLEPVTATGDPNGVVVCSGRLLLEVADGGGGEPRRLAADVEFAAQAASDGSGLVFELEGADAVVGDLAALGGPLPASAPAPPLKSDAPLDGAHRALHSTGPSFECTHVRLSSEQMICASRPLSQLDREMAALYYDEMARADERRRQLLRRTRDAFLARRDRCRDAGCIASVYEDRIAEIRRISRGR